jgi:hypothetical protein
MLSDRMYQFSRANCTTWQSSTHVVHPEVHIKQGDGNQCYAKISKMWSWHYI